MGAEMVYNSVALKVVKMAEWKVAEKVVRMAAMMAVG